MLISPDIKTSKRSVLIARNSFSSGLSFRTPSWYSRKTRRKLTPFSPVAATPFPRSKSTFLPLFYDLTSGRRTGAPYQYFSFSQVKGRGHIRENRGKRERERERDEMEEKQARRRREEREGEETKVGGYGCVVGTGMG